MNRAWIFGALALLLVLGGVRVALDLNARRDDRAAIRQALQDSIRASREGRPGSVLDLLSGELRVNDAAPTLDRGQIAQFIRDQKPNVEVGEIEPKIVGDTARVVTPVSLSVPLLGEQTLANVTLTFGQEDDRAYGIFPTKKWRLRELRVPEDAWAQFISQ